MKRKSEIFFCLFENHYIRDNEGILPTTKYNNYNMTSKNKKVEILNNQFISVELQNQLEQFRISLAELGKTHFGILDKLQIHSLTNLSTFSLNNSAKLISSLANMPDISIMNISHLSESINFSFNANGEYKSNSTGSISTGTGANTPNYQSSISVDDILYFEPDSFSLN